MGFHVVHRWGATETDPSQDTLRRVLEELDAEDDEHPCVSLTHESEWTVSAFPGGLVVWENVEQDSEPKHMRGISKDRVLELWLLLSRGDIQAIDTEPWKPGYGTRV